MSLSGQNNYKGINAQAWAAMSLFLQFLRDPKFSSIHLEGAKCEDFNLIFNDGRKIICESKARSEKFSYPQLKALLEAINSKKDIGQEDEILIVCSNANDDLITNIENSKYFPALKEKFEKKGFSEDIITLLPKVKFWIIYPKFNEEIIYSLFTQLVNFWVPLSDIQRVVDSILIQKIYKGSAKGQQYSRQMLIEEIEDFKKEVKGRGSYLKINKELEQKYLIIEKTVKANKGIDWGTGDISAISPWELATYALNLLKSKDNLDLQQWDDLWQLTKVSYCAFSIFDIFEKNLLTHKNRQYVLNYIASHLADIRTFYRDSYLDHQVLKIISKIIESKNGVSYLSNAFGIIKNILTYNVSDFFYLKERGHNPTVIWQKGELCKLLVRFYQLADPDLRQQIFNLAVENFDFTRDDGDFDFHAPREVFQIFKMWIGEDFNKRFPILIQKVCDQYDAFYGKYTKKKKKFFYDGWEHIGGGISFGGSYHASDRHFIGSVLSPAIRQFYNEDSAIGWKFIKEHCISAEKEVSRDRPDFLNRSVYEIVLDRYASDDVSVSNEAFEILKEWVLSRKGIPHKADLIYQALVRRPVSDTKKMKLIELTASKYEAPVNPFVEEIVTELAKKGLTEAEVQLRKWTANPKYYDRFMFEMDPMRSIKKLIDTNFDLALDLFKEFLKSDQVTTEKGDRFGAYDVAILLYEIFKKDYSKGSAILRALEEEKILSKNQQVIYTYSLFNYHGNDDSDDPEMLMKIYKDFVDPFLTNLENDNMKVCQRLTCSGPRTALVQFAVRLATKQYIAEALRILTIFVDDPDPYLPNLDPDDPENKYNRHLQISEGKDAPSIETVRGWCCWTLMKCAVLEGRPHISKVIELVEKLSKDENYYIVHMVCFSLSQLAKIRLTVLPEKRGVLFLDDDEAKALKTAKYIEKICFALFERILTFEAKAKQTLEVSILSVLTQIRALNQKDALELVNNLKEFTGEGMGEAAGLFLYYAEFRKNAYKDWKFTKPGLYDDLAPGKFDEGPFKRIIDDLMENGSDNLKQRFASQIEFLIRDSDEYLDMAIRYFYLLTKKYHHGTFGLIYHVINEKMLKKVNFNTWYGLYLSCLKTEKAFYNENSKDINKIEGIYWWPSLYNERTLLDVEIQGGKEKFLEAAYIVFSFPKELWINETDALIEKLLEYKNDKRVKTIVNNLFERNPSKYFDLKKRLK